MEKNKRYAVIIILVTNAILISLLETLIPIPIPVPGVKLGLASIITLIAMTFLPVKDVLLVVLIRCFVVAVLTRGIMMLAFSLSGGLLSALVMIVLYKYCSRLFSIKGISIVGAIFHNTTQIVVASMLLGEALILYYLPILLVSAVITGFITGSIGELAISEIRKKGIFSAGKNLKEDERISTYSNKVISSYSSSVEKPVNDMVIPVIIKDDIVTYDIARNDIVAKEAKP